MTIVADALPEGVWLNVGSGPAAPPGWTSIDGSWQARLAGGGFLAAVARHLTGTAVGHWPAGIVCRDIRRGLGVAPGTAAAIFTSHLIEHLHRSEAHALLCDAHRALRRDGVCRVVTPDLAALVDAYVLSRGTNGQAAGDRLQDALLLHPRELPRVAQALGWYRRMTEFDHHKWLYDGETLCALFREAGFEQPSVRAFLDSAIPTERLCEVERADRVCGGAGLCVEARR